MGKNVAGKEESHKSEREDAYGVGEGYSASQYERVPEGSPGPDQIRGDHRFSVAWRECMRATQDKGGSDAQQYQPECHFLTAH
ncbi:MAG TPA: hypothetical protein VMZ52_14355, partial [Bryobacteraceae bacterium]|nr:hypothetical protein [Bryobacteraceae bacterium]